MKAVLSKEVGGPETLVLEELPDPVAGAGQVLIDVKACGVNYPDVLIIEDKYQFKPTRPFAPGGEVSGVISAVGEGVTRFKVGDRVLASTGWGGYAEKLALEEGRCTPIPDNMPFDEAAAIVLTYGTSYYALKERGVLKAGETLLVLGAAGGTGLSAIELGKLMGARVIAAASSEEKLALCRQAGADDTINYASEDLREGIMRLTGGRGVDVVYDPVGGDYTEAALRSMAWEGRLLVIGFTTGTIPRPALNLTLLKGCSIVGVFYGAFSEREPARYDALMQELLGWLREGRIRPIISAHMPIEQATQALEILGRREVKGKIVLTTALGREGGLP